jgi:hypothetical protein
MLSAGQLVLKTSQTNRVGFAVDSASARSAGRCGGRTTQRRLAENRRAATESALILAANLQAGRALRGSVIEVLGHLQRLNLLPKARDPIWRGIAELTLADLQEIRRNGISPP